MDSLKTSMPTRTQSVHSGAESLVELFGTLLQFLVTPTQVSGAFALMRAVVPPGVSVPLHSHADPEVLVILGGELNVLQHEADSSRWLTSSPGEIVCIPSDVRHALRNRSRVPVTLLLITTQNVYRFFRELGRPFRTDQPSGLPSPEEMQRLVNLAAQHNYWMASSQENAAIGLDGF